MQAQTQGMSSRRLPGLAWAGELAAMSLMCAVWAPEHSCRHAAGRRAGWTLLLSLAPPCTQVWVAEGQHVLGSPLGAPGPTLGGDQPAG